MTLDELYKRLLADIAKRRDSEMSEEYIELCHYIEDGVHVIRDQHGRRIRGFQIASVSFGFDQVTVLNIQCIQYKDGQAHINKKYPQTPRGDK